MTPNRPISPCLSIPARVLRWLVLGILWSHFSLAHADAQQLPDLGDDSGALISPYEERQLGESVMRQARRQLRFIDDPELLDYLNALGASLVAHADRPGYDFRFYLVDNNAINAFAVPGGFVTTHTGLVLAAETEAELASVLAHEIVHITQRHIPRMLAGQQRSMGATLAALLAAIVLIQAGQGQAGEAAIALSAATQAQRSLNFTRSNEEEADRVGVALLAAAGFDPRAMPVFFKKLQSWSRIYETNLPEYLQTHPLTLRRIAESENRAAQYPPGKRTDSSAYHHFRAKIRAFGMERPQDAIKVFETTLENKDYRYERAERYGYALALSRGRQHDKARRQIAGLLRQDPKNMYYRIAQGDIEMAAGNTKTALALYARAYKDSPTHHALLRRYGRALLRLNRHNRARTILEAGIRQYPGDPTLYKMLATAAGQLGDKVAAHRALAEYYYLRGNPGAAVQQLNLALQFLGDNSYLEASLKARIQAIEGQTTALEH